MSPKSIFWVDSGILPWMIFPMIYFFLNSEFWAEIYGHLNIANYPFLYILHSGANILRHQLMTLIEVNMSGTRENFVWFINNNYDRELITTHILLFWCYGQKLQQFGNEYFVPFHIFSRPWNYFSQTCYFPNSARLEKFQKTKFVSWRVHKMSSK